MIIKIQSDFRASLEEPHVFSDFKVVLVGNDIGSLRTAGPFVFGRLDDGSNHIWVDQGWLRSAGPQDPQWQAGLDAMIAFAGKKGWLDETGSIRAHVELNPRAIVT